MNSDHLDQGDELPRPVYPSSAPAPASGYDDSPPGSARNAGSAPDLTPHQTPDDGAPRDGSDREGGASGGAFPPSLPIVSAADMLSPPREITATTTAAKILFTRDDLDTTYVSGRKGTMVLSLVEDGTSYRVGRYDVQSGEWRILSKGWPRFGNALAFACTIVS